MEALVRRNSNPHLVPHLKVRATTHFSIFSNKVTRLQLLNNLIGNITDGSRTESDNEIPGSHALHNYLGHIVHRVDQMHCVLASPVDGLRNC
jgi:hypothetical protein